MYWPRVKKDSLKTGVLTEREEYYSGDKQIIKSRKYNKAKPPNPQFEEIKENRMK